LDNLSSPPPSSPLTGVLTESQLAQAARAKAAAESEELAVALRADLGRLSGSLEVQARTVAGLTEGLTRSERDGLARFKDIRDRQTELRTELNQAATQAAETVRREVEARLENLRRNLVEMIGSSEIRVAEAEDRVKVVAEAVANLKVVEHNHHLSLENKLEAAKNAAEALVVANNNKNKNKETEQTLMSLRKELGKD
jgi:hypothetical protein